MSNLVGRVNFTATLDGRGTERDAEQIGRKAGAAAGEGYDEKWNKSFRDTLTESGKKSYDAWKKAGAKDATGYGEVFKKRFDLLQKQGRDALNGIRLDPGFLDDFGRKFDDAGLAAGELQKQLRSLEGVVNTNSLNAAKAQVDEWAKSQRDAAIEVNRTTDAHREQVEQLNADLRQAYRQVQIEINEATDAERRRNTEVERGRQVALDALGSDIRQAYRQVQLEINATRDAERQRIDDMVRGALEHDDAIVRNVNAMQALRAERDRALTGADHDIDLTRRLSDAMERTIHSTDRLSLSWQDLSHNTRQWTLIIGAVLAAMEDLAVLGSAAGAGLVAVGGAATSALAGVGGLVAVFVTLGKDIEKLPADLRPVATEFKNLRDVFSDLRETIARGAFSEMDGVFTGLGTNIKKLSPALRELGEGIGRIFSDLEKNTRPGTKAFNAINEALLLAKPNFAALADIAGTLGVALLNAFNRAQPLVEDMFDWLGRLADQFDSFVRSDGFDQWMRNAQRTFESFGPLLDAFSRGLNDLVTPDSVTRTKQFLDNLTEFMPNLTAFLDVLGKLDIFGLLAGALNQFGQAMEPLGPAAADLAEALSRILALSFEQLGGALAGVAAAIAPAVQMAADFLASLPEDVIRGAANGVLVLAGAFIALQAGAAIGGAITSIRLFSQSLDDLAIAGGRAGGALAGLGRLGVVGAVAAGAAFGVEALGKAISEELLPPASEIQQGFNDAKSGLDLFNTALRAEGIDNVNVARDGLEKLGMTLDDIGSSTWLDPVAPGLSAIVGQINKIDEGLGTLAQTNLPAAAKAFATLSEDAGLTAYQQRVLLDEMDSFSGVLETQGINVQGLAGAQDLLAIATAGTVEAQAAAAEAANENVTAIELLGGASDDAADRISKLGDLIRNFGDTQISTIEATSAFEAALDDLSASVAENGATLDLNTQEGRDNQAAMLDSIQAAKDMAVATLEQTGSVDQANAVLATQKQRLQDTLQQMGMTEDQARDYITQLNLIPDDVMTVAQADTAAAESALANLARTRYATVRVQTIIDRSAMSDLNGSVSGSGRYGTFATGGTVYGPTHALVGEAGPEAIVPLNRPLSMVDESVRWLSAIAQGKGGSNPRMASGGIAGGSGVTVAEGAIVVHDYSGDSRRTANEVVTRFVERVKG